MPIPASLRSQLRLPVIGAPLFIVSSPRLVIEQCKAGIIGSFPALNARPAHVLEEWLQQITHELDAFKQQHPDRKVAPFAVNQIVHASNDRLGHDVELPTIVDDSLRRFERVWCGAGTPHAVFETTVDDLLAALPDAAVVPV